MYEIFVECQLQRQIGITRAVGAPFGGVITRRHLDVGESVSFERPLFKLVDDSQKFIRFFVSEAQLPFIKEGLEVQFNPTFATTDMHKAVIARISKAVDPETGTIMIEADIAEESDDNHIISHTTVRVNIPTSTDENLMVLPERALELAGEKDIVWVVDNETVTAQKRNVEVEFRQSGFAYIRSGIDLKDWIIIKSPVELKEGLEIDTKQ